MSAESYPENYGSRADVRKRVALPSCHKCNRQLLKGESAWASDWTVVDLGHLYPRTETRYTCDDCEARP